MLKIAALFALVLFVSAKPPPGFETERAFKALEVVSKTATMTEQMVRNAAGAYKKGLECYQHIFSDPQKPFVAPCVLLGDADFCMKVEGPDVTTRGCAFN